MRLFLLGWGLVLAILGLGTAGWLTYRYVTAPEVPLAAPAPELKQDWLISPTGGLVPEDRVRAFLLHSRYVPGRSIRLTLRAPLTDLLTADEALPAAPYLPVMADIRAPKLAEGLCARLSGWAADCALQAARLVPGSLDAAGTALFTVELVFRQGEESDLPDLATHVLQDQTLDLQLPDGDPGTESPAAALTAATEAVRTACQADAARQNCRLQSLALDWQAGRPVTIRATLAWLQPLPPGIFTAPPLGPAPGG